MPVSSSDPEVGRWGGQGAGVGAAGPHRATTCLAGVQLWEPFDWMVLDTLQDNLEEDALGAGLWSTTITLLSLFMLSLFYSAALTLTSLWSAPRSQAGPRY